MSTDLINRLKKRNITLSKWALHNNLTCYRLYTKDLAEFPFICDIYNEHVVVWVFDRKKDDTQQKKETYITTIRECLQKSLQCKESNIHLKFRSKQKGLTQQYSKLSSKEKTIIIEENNLKFELNLSDYLDVGIFLDHRKTRKFSQQLVKNKSILNLFAYTGSFSVYAYSAKASHITSVDLNKNYIQWIEKNFNHNNFKKRVTDTFVNEDCFKFLTNSKYTQKFDVIICDPPTFSNSKKMNSTFSINEDYTKLLNLCLSKLNPKGIIIFSTNSKSFKLNQDSFSENLNFRNITNKMLPFDFKGKIPHQCWLLSYCNDSIFNLKL